MFCCFVCLCAVLLLMCVNVLFVSYCVMLCGLLVVVFVCSFEFRFVFDVSCDVLWHAFVLCSCG